MKLKFFIIIVFLFLFNSIKAQDFKSELFFDSGFTGNSYFGQVKDIKIKAEYGFIGGLDFSILFGKFALGTGISYKSIKFYKIFSFIRDKDLFYLNYLTIPVFFEKDYKKFFFKTGFENNLPLKGLNIPNKNYQENLKNYPDFTMSIFLNCGVKINEKVKINLVLFTDFTPSFYSYWNNSFIGSVDFSNAIMLGLSYDFFTLNIKKQQKHKQID